MDDVIFDIEVTSNRVDCMSMVGLAREAATVFKSPFNYKQIKLSEGSQEKSLNVSVKDPDLCPRYMAVVMDDIKVEPSPLWLQMRLLLSGHRPINNIVDITNYVLHELGQPLHAFDYDKLQGHEIVVRRARAGEDFVALDESKHELTSDNLVIADAMEPVAIAGVMGGLHSGVSESTKTIVFEAATFDPTSVRKTARGLGLYSDSQLLFEKGISSMSPQAALARAVELVKETAGGEVVSRVFDVQAGDYSPLHFPFDPKKVINLIGVHVDTDKMIDILERLGFSVKIQNAHYEVFVPFWRDHDIENEVDLVEEIARVFGYHNIPSVLPQNPPPMTMGDRALEWEDWTRQYLKSAGYTEFYGYSFVSREMLEKYDISPESALALHNPLSSELTHLRTSL
ncbi:phenylalanine--tRNA ligase subunit beta, partial [Patescibacteria group bacterium]|nr:phenylalanine--tRNA ligase subunit beta [Patescibacteria group bacterium]